MNGTLYWAEAANIPKSGISINPSGVSKGDLRRNDGRTHFSCYNHSKNLCFNGIATFIDTGF